MDRTHPSAEDERGSQAGGPAPQGKTLTLLRTVCNLKFVKCFRNFPFLSGRGQPKPRARGDCASGLAFCALRKERGEADGGGGKGPARLRTEAAVSAVTLAAAGSQRPGERAKTAGLDAETKPDAGDNAAAPSATPHRRQPSASEADFRQAVLAEGHVNSAGGRKGPGCRRATPGVPGS